MLRYSPKRSQSHRERVPEIPQQRNRPRNRSSSPLLRLIRYPSPSPKKTDQPSVEPILSQAEALRIIENVSARSRTPMAVAIPAKDPHSFPLPKSWKITPVPASSPKRGPSPFLSLRQHSSANSHGRRDEASASSKVSATREIASPPVSVYSAHDDPFRISPRLIQVPFAAPPSKSVLLSSSSTPIVKVNLPLTQVESYPTIASSTLRGPPNIGTSFSSAQSHPSASGNPVVKLRQSGPPEESLVTLSGDSTFLSRSSSSGPAPQIISQSSGKHTNRVADLNPLPVLDFVDRETNEDDISLSSRRLNLSIPTTSSLSPTKGSRKDRILHPNTHPKPLEPSIMPSILGHHRSESAPSASPRSAKSPGKFQRNSPSIPEIRLPSRTSIAPVSSVDQGSPPRTLGHQSALPGPMKNPSRRHGFIYGSPDVPLPYLRRSPPDEAISDINTGRTSPSFESVSGTSNVIPEKEIIGLSPLKGTDVEDLYSPVSDAIERYFFDDETSAGSITVPIVHVDQATPPLNSAASSSSRSSFTDVSPPVSPTRSQVSSISPTRSMHDPSLSASSVSSFTAVTESSSLKSVYNRTLTSAPKIPPLVLRPKTPLYDSPQITVPLPNTSSFPTRTSDSLAHPLRKPALKTTASNAVQPQRLHNALPPPSLLGVEMMIPSHSHHRSVSADDPQPESKTSRLLGLLRLSSGSRAEHRRVASTSATRSASSMTREPKGVRSSPQGGLTASGSLVNISTSTKMHGRLSDVVGTAASLK